MNIKELIRAEVDARRQSMVYELFGLEEYSPHYHRVKGMHDAYVDMLTYLDYSISEEMPNKEGVRRGVLIIDKIEKHIVGEDFHEEMRLTYTDYPANTIKED